MLPSANAAKAAAIPLSWLAQSCRPVAFMASCEVKAKVKTESVGQESARHGKPTSCVEVHLAGYPLYGLST
jgi:hypothetical protein